MTELEKIAYAKSFIDKLANGINPLDDMPIPENEIVNNVRISRCFFYVSNLLQREIEQGFRNQPKEKKPGREPFSLTPEQLQQFEYSVQPITATAIGRKLNWIVREEIEAKKMKRFSNKKILYWLRSIGLIEWREWDGKQRRFPTEEGEAMGLSLVIWSNYGKRIPVIFFSEEAQRFVIDNLEAVLAAEKGSLSPAEEEETAED